MITRKYLVIYYKISLFIILTLVNYLISIEIIWNGPTEQCQRNSTNKINYGSYGISTNNDCQFRGEKIVVLYERDIGRYPYIKMDNESQYEEHNNGLPQKVNMSEHLKQLEKKIEEIIPDKNFSGLGVIDIEEWRPTYDSNWSSKRVYRNESIKIVLARNSTLNSTEAEKLAIKEFNKAAADFFIETIKKCKELRPNAKWGFYGFPTCNENAENRGWNFCFPNISNQIIPILNHTDVLYPSPYIVPGQNYSIKDKFVNAVLDETQRIVEEIIKIGGNKKKIYMYNKIEVDQQNVNYENIEFYDPYYLCIVYNRAIDYNIDGVIVWTTSQNMSKRCQYIKKYVDNVFGPYIQSMNLFHPFFINTPFLNFINKFLLRKDSLKIDCSKLLTNDNIQDWCKTNFYGPNCMASKLNSSGLDHQKY
ncbi:Aldolase-type TIM barrel domain and Glycoside hydrolase, superfamily domain and Hyaluronidase family-containing protein [Strongyloides ratti]|uniref:Hyaluronidase n=1 Tax=Strongyloides ratti TaxID=34506 RepID=A0A090LM81_STRRB|nr:Aldolase-type TIM barrel domain and Glycoside hydrolase, superfamily domain and Hyaluronidase family-containing protein [Strongyloides ratti]CEF70836.1 Aldolase-type TIM barrel domain and Glycoside hydrolase, superfamily domain and Hyaluronidase family-containing protein [Strongyloides ratti]